MLQPTDDGEGTAIAAGERGRVDDEEEGALRVRHVSPSPG